MGEALVDPALIAEIVNQVLTLMAGRKATPIGKKVLMLFSGASTGNVEGVNAIRQLSQDGHCVTVVLSAGGKFMAGGEERLIEAGANQVIGPETWINTPGMVRETDLLLVPTLSMNFAAHLALGLMESAPATLVLGALLAGKPVVAIADGADPDGAGGKVFGAGGGAAVLRTRLQNNLKTLSSYGVELVGPGEFLAAAQRHLGWNGSHGIQASKPASRPAVIITQAEVADLAQGSTLRLSPGSRLTPLALETLARLQIRVVEE